MYSGREVISTINLVCGITREEVGQHRLADRIDPVGVLDDVKRRFGARQRGGVDQGRQPAPSRVRVDLGQRHIGVGDAEQIIKQQHILRVGIRDLFPHCARASSPSRSATPVRARSSRVTAWNGISRVWDSQKVQNTSSSASGRGRGGLPGHPAFADARRSHDIDHATAGTDGAVRKGVEGRHLPAPTDQTRLGAAAAASARADRHQSAHRNRFIRPLDVRLLGFTQQHDVLDQPSGRLGQHHPARRGHRFHPLRQPDGSPVAA